MTIIFKCGFSGANLGKNNGCDKAPEQILFEFNDSIFLNERGTKTNFYIKDIPVNNLNIEETNKNIFNYIKEELNKNKKEKIVLIGGDHSITFSSFKAFNQHFSTEKNLLIVFDAHADCVNNFNPPTHEDYLKTLIGGGALNPKNVLLLGLRNITGKEMEYLKMSNINFYPMKRIFNIGITEFTDTITEIANQYDNIYLSIDIDVVDPAFAPGTGYLEPAGFSSREFLYVIERLLLVKKIRLVDIVEINPKKDINNMTVRLGAKIINEII